MKIMGNECIGGQVSGAAETDLTSILVQNAKESKMNNDIQFRGQRFRAVGRGLGSRRTVSKSCEIVWTGANECCGIVDLKRNLPVQEALLQ